jgi:hypothetical protein
VPIRERQGKPMKRFSHKAHRASAKPEAGEALTPPGTPPAQAPRRWLPGWAVPVLCVAVGAAVTIAVFEFWILSRLPTALLGKWVVVEGEMEGATLEFFRDGTGKLTNRGNVGTVKAKVSEDGKTLWTTVADPVTGKEVTHTQTIVSLTETELELEDRGTVLKLERASGKGE